MSTPIPFQTTKPDISALRARYPSLAELLHGEFADKPNVYEFPQGTVVSWELLQGKPKNPTYGRIPPGKYEFPTSHTEEVTVLEGDLEARIGDATHPVGPLQKITALPNTILRLDVKGGPVHYFCEYR